MLRTALFFIITASPSFAWRGPVPVIIPALSESPGLRAETMEIANGAELMVFFEKLVANEQTARTAEIPLLAVLRDTMGDANSANDRLRQVWVFTYSSPSIAQRIVAGVPLFYHRSGLDSGSATRPPRPLLDLGRPGAGVWRGMALSVVQSQALDPVGSIARLTTRSYGGNLAEYRQTHVAEVLDIISRDPTQLASALTPGEVETLQGRLELSSKLLGGMVSDDSLPSVYSRALERRSENRGHNWEILRQTAEQNGLYFEPLHLEAAPDSFGILWIVQKDAESGHPFEGQLLHIANPFKDERIRSWNGVSQIWTLDRQGARLLAGTDRGVPVKMIPLAVYALDYPAVPLLIIDFRHASHPQHTERRLRAANDITTGVLGLTTFSSFSYFLAKATFFFVHRRHGAPTDRMERRNAFISLRHALETGDSLDEAVRRDLESRIEKLDLDPVEKSWAQEVGAAWRQYDTLMKFAADPNGLAKTVERDRIDEYRAATTGPIKRLATAILHPHRKIDSDKLADLSRHRQLTASKRQRTDLPDKDVAARVAEPTRANRGDR